MFQCLCDYDLLRKGLADKNCPVCYSDFAEQQKHYHQLIEAVRQFRDNPIGVNKERMFELVKK